MSSATAKHRGVGADPDAQRVLCQFAIWYTSGYRTPSDGEGGIGSLSDIQVDCTSGDYMRMQINVHFGQHSTIGDHIWIFLYVVLTNDPHPPIEIRAGVTVEDFAAVVVTMSVILSGVRVGSGLLVAAHRSVQGDVAPDTDVDGAPAKYLCDTTKLQFKDSSGDPAYPWRRHFHRGYPREDVDRWIAEFSKAEEGLRDDPISSAADSGVPIHKSK